MAKQRSTRNFARVTGTIDGHLQRVSGPVSDVFSRPVYSRTLVYRWTEGSGKGSGKFTLADDGNSFEGWWNSGDDPDIAQNSWNGTRK